MVLKLEIGAGSNPQEGYIHHDVRDMAGIDIICDARKFPSEHKDKYSEVYASNILEHFNRFEIDAVFKEWASLLHLGGVMKIIVPDIREISSQFVNGHIDHAFFVYLCYGGNDYEYNRHYYGFDETSLRVLFERHKLKIIKSSPGIPWEKRKTDRYCPMVTMWGKKY